MHAVLAAYGVFEDLVNLESDPFPVFFNRVPWRDDSTSINICLLNICLGLFRSVKLEVSICLHPDHLTQIFRPLFC